MRKRLAWILVCVTILSLCACGKQAADSFSAIRFWNHAEWDICSAFPNLGSLGYGAIPYLAELADDPDQEVAETARDILTHRFCYIEDFRDWNYSKAAAEHVLERYPTQREQTELLPG